MTRALDALAGAVVQPRANHRGARVMVLPAAHVAAEFDRERAVARYPDCRIQRRDETGVAIEA